MGARDLQKLIHVGCRELGLDADARRDLQQAATGKASMRDMTEADLRLVVDRLKASGFDPGSGRVRHPRAPRADLRLVHVLWRMLGEAGELKQPGRAGLNAFIRRRFGDAWGSVPADIDMLRDWEKIDTVIQALIDWCERAGIEVDEQERGR